MNTEKTTLFIQKYNMLPDGTKVLCAVSGGADSVCLLHFLHSLDNINVVCAHFNHRLRGQESDRDEKFVRDLCQKLGVECFVGSGDVSAYAAENGMGTEEAARALRYAFLEKIAEETGAERIATAHNAEDNAETVLLNLARGTGLKGLCGIPPVRGKIIRPLLKTTRTEIIAYLEKNDLAHVEDSTNESDDYARNRLRHHVLPVLREQNAAAVENISAASELLRDDEEYLSSLAIKFVNEHLKDKSLPVSELILLPKPVMMRVFRLMCGGSLGSQHAESIKMLCCVRAVHASVDVPGMRVTREYDRLIFAPEQAAEITEREIMPGTVTQLPEVGLAIICEKIEKCHEVNKTLNTFYFKSENICDKIIVASRRAGGKIELEGRKCSKTLKKLFSEAGIPLKERDETPVFYDSKGVIAIAGFGVAQRCAAAPGDDVIKIMLLKKE